MQAGTQIQRLDDGLAALSQLRTAPRFQLAYRSRDTAGDFPFLCEAVAGIGDPSLPTLLVVDEVDQMDTPQSVGADGRGIDVLPFRRLVNYGRHVGVSIAVASRRAAAVSRNLTAQATEIVSFRQSEPRDVDYLRQFCGREFSDAVRRLPRLRYGRYVPGEAFEFGSVDPRRRAETEWSALEADLYPKGDDDGETETEVPTQEDVPQEAPIAPEGQQRPIPTETPE